MNTESKPHNIAEGNKGEEKPKSAFEEGLLQVKTLDNLHDLASRTILDKGRSAVLHVINKLKEYIKRNENPRIYFGSDGYKLQQSSFPEGVRELLHDKISSIVGPPEKNKDTPDFGRSDRAADLDRKDLRKGSITPKDSTTDL